MFSAPIDNRTASERICAARVAQCVARWERHGYPLPVVRALACGITLGEAVLIYGWHHSRERAA